MAGNTSNTGSWVPQVHTVGLRNVGSYQVSGHPYLTGSSVAFSTNSGGLYVSAGEHKLPFPYVTQAITVANLSTSGTALRVHFREKSAGNVWSGKHYVELAIGANVTLEMKCKEIYLSVASSDADYMVIADLTNIPTSRMYELTGSGITE